MAKDEPDPLQPDPALQLAVRILEAVDVRQPSAKVGRRVAPGGREVTAAGQGTEAKPRRPGCLERLLLLRLVGELNGQALTGRL